MSEAVLLGLISAVGAFAASYLTFAVKLRDIERSEKETRTKHELELEVAREAERGRMRAELWDEIRTLRARLDECERKHREAARDYRPRMQSAEKVPNMPMGETAHSAG